MAPPSSTKIGTSGAVTSPLVVNLAELLRRPGTQKAVHSVTPAYGLKVVDSAVPDGADLTVDVVLESLTDGIVVAGSVGAPWEALCRRCLEPVTGTAEAEVHELYQPASATPSDDAFTFRGDQLDLEPMAREAILLELPLAPLCRPDCAGLCAVCGVNRNEGDCGHEAVVRDARWAALDELLDPGRLDLRDN